MTWLVTVPYQWRHRATSFIALLGQLPCQFPVQAVQCNGVYKNLLTKILSGYFFAETRTSGGYPTLGYSILLNIATNLELRKATHAAKLELLEATLVALESYKRRCTVGWYWWTCEHVWETHVQVMRILKSLELASAQENRVWIDKYCMKMTLW